MGYILGEPTVQQYFDANGDPLENGTIEFYVWDTSTPTGIYSDSTGTSAGKSVTLNSIGAPMYGGTSIALFFYTNIVYKIVRKDSFGTVIEPTIGPYSVINSTSSQFGFTAKTLLVPEIVSTDSSLVDIDFDLTGLPATTYDRFIIEGYAKSTNTSPSEDRGYIYFNEDLTDSNYFKQNLYGRNALPQATSSGDPEIIALATSYASTAPNNDSVFTITIENPMSASFVKNAISTGNSRDGVNNRPVLQFGVTSSITDKITRIRIQTNNYAVDKIVGKFRIYGEREVSVVAAELSGTVPLPVDAFISVWATTVDGETLTIPTKYYFGNTFNAVVDWGDGTVETITTWNGFSHVYAAAGDHTIIITGTFQNIYMNNNVAIRHKLKKVLNLGTVGWTNLDRAFHGCSNLTEFTAGTTDTSAITSMYYMFYLCSGLASADVYTLDTSSVQDLSVMFHTCSSLTSLDVSSFDTANVTNMSAMFYNCPGLTSLDLSSFDTANVRNMTQMFGSCNALTSMVGVEDFIITGLDGTGDLDSFLTSGKMTTAQYDNLLIKWEAQASGIPVMTPSFGTSKYTGGGAAEAAHDSLTDVYGWSIYDSGIV